MRTLLQSTEQPSRLQVLGPQCRNAAPSFFMAVAHHFARYTELWKDMGFLACLILNCFQLKTDARKALRERVVHFMRQSFALIEHSLHPPSLDEDVSDERSQGQKKGADNQRHDVACAPPRRAFDDLDIVEGGQKYGERSKVMRVGRIDDADSAQTEPAHVLQMA